MKVACITEQVLTLVNKRIGLYRHFDETINRYKQSRDVSTLNSGKKSLETEHKALTSEIALLQSRLKTEGADLCDRVSGWCVVLPAWAGHCHRGGQPAPLFRWDLLALLLTANLWDEIATWPGLVVWGAPLHGTSTVGVLG